MAIRVTKRVTDQLIVWYQEDWAIFVHSVEIQVDVNNLVSCIRKTFDENHAVRQVQLLV